jgi:hypothetical protein
MIGEGTRIGPRLVLGGRRAPEDEVVVLGLGSGGRKCCASSRRRDVEDGWIRTRAWVEDVDVRLAQFSSATAGTACTKRDDADMYAGPEIRVVRSATPHPVFTVITSLISLSPSLPSFPSLTFADAHSIAINAFAGAQTLRAVANDTISDGVGW